MEECPECEGKLEIMGGRILYCIECEGDQHQEVKNPNWKKEKEDFVNDVKKMNKKQFIDFVYYVGLHRIQPDVFLKR